MPGLPRQHVDLIPHLNQSVDDKTAPTSVGVNAVNMVRVKGNEYRKRTGNTALATGGILSTTLPNVWQLGTHKNSLVALPNAPAQTPWVYSEAASKWYYGDTVDPLPIRSECRGPVTSSRKSIYGGELRDASTDHESNASGTLIPPSSPDIAVVPGSNYAVAVWENAGTATTVTEVIYDLTTGETIARNTFTGDHPHVEATSTYVTVVYYNGSTSICFRDWNSTSAPTGTPTHNTSRSATMPGTLASRVIDTVTTQVAGQVAVAYLQSASVIVLGLYTQSTQGFSVINIAPADVAFYTLGFLRDLQADGHIYLGVADTTNGVTMYIRNADASASSAPLLSGDATTAKANVRNITGFTVPAGFSGDFVCLWDLSPAAVSSSGILYDAQIMYCNKSAGVVGSPGVWQRSVSLRSKCALLASQDVIVLTSYGSYVQPTYFLFDLPSFPDGSKRAPITKINRWRGAGSTENLAGLTGLVAYGSSWLMAVPRMLEARAKPDPRTDAAGALPHVTVDTVGVDVVTLTKNPTNTGRPIEYADTMLVPMGQVMAFDGLRFCESDFCVYPEELSANQTTGGHLVSSSSYGWCAVYRWVDAQGRVHRSTPSVPLYVAMSSSNTKVTLTVPTLRILGIRDVTTTGSAVNDGVTIELYRTESNKTTFYLRSEFANDPTTRAISFVDEQADGDLDLPSCTQLYCAIADSGGSPQPGFQENHSPPQFTCMVVHRGRVWGIDADDPRVLWFSEVLAQGVGPIFNESQTIMLDDEWGDNTALASMDDKLLTFKRGAIFAVLGDGPDNTGISGAYSSPSRMAIGPGTLRPRSVQVTPDGCWFQSPKGIYLFDRGLNAQPLGFAAEDALGTANVLDVVHSETQSHVYLYLDSGIALVWDYQWREWYSWTGQTTYAAVKYGAKVAQVSPGSQATVWVSDSTVYEDATADYNLKLTCAWFGASGLAGFQRVYWIMVTGTYHAAATIYLNIYYDYIDSPFVEQREFDISSAAWPIMYKPARQKCSAMKVELLITATGRAVDISGMGLVVGVKNPGAKVPTSQRFGAVGGGS